MPVSTCQWYCTCDFKFVFNFSTYLSTSNLGPSDGKGNPISLTWFTFRSLWNWKSTLTHWGNDLSLEIVLVPSYMNASPATLLGCDDSWWQTAIEFQDFWSPLVTTSTVLGSVRSTVWRFYFYPIRLPLLDLVLKELDVDILDHKASSESLSELHVVLGRIFYSHDCPTWLGSYSDVAVGLPHIARFSSGQSARSWFVD